MSSVRIRVTCLAAVALAVALAPPALAAKDDLVLVSRSAAGGPAADGSSFEPAISDDGRYVVFESRADNLSTVDDDAVMNVFRRDLLLDDLALVTSGSPSDATSPAVSGDGHLVTFERYALNPDSGEDYASVFVYDFLDVSTSLVSDAPGGDPARGDSFGVAVSDGSHVLLDSDADNLSRGDRNAYINVFVREGVGGPITLVSRASGANGAPGNGNSFAGGMSSDGRFVVFESLAKTLTAVDRPRIRDVFVRDTVLNRTRLMSRASGEGPAGAADSSEPSISLGGRYVVFASRADNLVPAGRSAPVDRNIFIRDRRTGKVRLVSRKSGAQGRVANGDSSSPVVSEGGRYVAFLSDANNLSPVDENSVVNVFVRDMRRHRTILVSRAAGANGTPVDTGVWNAIDMSADGRYVVFQSAADSLSPEDDDGVDNIFVRDVLGP